MQQVTQGQDHLIRKYREVDEHGSWITYTLVHPRQCWRYTNLKVWDDETNQEVSNIVDEREVCPYQMEFDAVGLYSLHGKLDDQPIGDYPVRYWFNTIMYGQNYEVHEGGFTLLERIDSE